MVYIKLISRAIGAGWWAGLNIYAASFSFIAYFGSKDFCGRYLFIESIA